MFYVVSPKRITKITVKTNNHKYAASNDAFQGKICSWYNQCCEFGIPKNKLKKGGTLEITSSELGKCNNFRVMKRIETIWLKNSRFSDTWIADYVEVEVSQSLEKQVTRCPLDVWVRGGEITRHCPKGLSYLGRLSQLIIFKLSFRPGHQESYHLSCSASPVEDLLKEV